MVKVLLPISYFYFPSLSIALSASDCQIMESTSEWLDCHRCKLDSTLTTNYQNSRLIQACFLMIIDEVWIDLFCFHFDWWRRLQYAKSMLHKIPTYTLMIENHNNRCLVARPLKRHTVCVLWVQTMIHVWMQCCIKCRINLDHFIMARDWIMDFLRRRIISSHTNDHMAH